MTILHVDYAVVIEEEVHWFEGFVQALYFAIDNKVDLVENIEFDNGDKLRRNLMTGESKVY